MRTEHWIWELNFIIFVFTTTNLTSATAEAVCARTNNIATIFTITSAIIFMCLKSDLKLMRMSIMNMMSTMRSTTLRGEQE